MYFLQTAMKKNNNYTMCLTAWQILLEEKGNIIIIIILSMYGKFLICAPVSEKVFVFFVFLKITIKK